jgi:hypothetical protein
MSYLATDLRGAGHEVTTWEELTNPGFLFPPIADAIQAADLVLAETSLTNLNVMFEVGYAIALNKAVYQLIDERSTIAKVVDVLGIVRYVPYSTRPDVVRAVEKLNLNDEPLGSQLGLEPISQRLGGLYFIPSKTSTDLNESLWQLCHASSFAGRTIDKSDSVYTSLRTQAKSISDADVVTTLLVRDDLRGARINNAQLMLFAGVARGLNRELLVLVQQPNVKVLDLEDNGATFVTETEAKTLLSSWLSRRTSEFVRTPRPPRSIRSTSRSALGRMFLGSLDARADFKLPEYFYSTPEYHQAEAGYRHLFVGGKGAGKTANFERLSETFSQRNIVLVSIAPSDFEFPRLAAVLEQNLLSAHWVFLYGSFWRFILLTEILREVRSRFLSHLLRTPDEPYAKALLAWFDQNEYLLAPDFTTRVSLILERLSSVEGDQASRQAALVDILQYARMYEIERHLRTFAGFFEVRIVLDDLDRNWNPAVPAANQLILSLLNELQSLMSAMRGTLYATIFLRSDVYESLLASDPEFIKRDPTLLRWTRDSLEILIAQRIAVQADAEESDPTLLWNMVFPKSIQGIDTATFIISRTLLRPRDVLQFCQLAIESAQHAGRILVAEEDIVAAWDNSGERILAQAETEYQYVYPELASLVYAFLAKDGLLPWTEAVVAILQTVSKLASPPEWMERAIGEPGRFLEALYKVGLLGVVSPAGDTWFEADRRFGEVLPWIGDDLRVSIHPAFQRYLRNV